MEKSFFKKYRWAVTISIVLASCFFLYMAFIFKLPYVRNYDKTEPVNSTGKTLYTKIAVYNKDCKYPFVQTDIDNIFYLATPKKDIKFYEYSKGKFKNISKTHKIELSLTLNGEKVPISIKYITKDRKVLGYGTYVSDKNSSINKYAFFKLCDMPSGMSTDYDLLLLIDFDSKDIFNSNKTYSEVFQLNSKTKKATRLVSENDRKLSIKDGKLRNDFCIVTDDSIKSCRDRILFLSSRNYNISNSFYSKDIYSQYKYTKHPTLVAQNVLGEYIRQTNDGIIYLKKSSNNYIDRFCLTQKEDGAKEKILKAFDGNFDNGFIICGDYLIDCNEMKLYNLINMKSTLLDLSINNVKAFDVSPDNKKLVLYCKLDNENQELIFYDLASNKSKHIDEKEFIYKDYPNLRFINNDKISYIRPSESSDNRLGNMIVSWNDIFSKLE